MAVPVPANYDTVQIDARYVSFDGVPLQGNVIFTPSIAWLVSGSTETVILTKPVTGKVVDGVLLDASGKNPLRLFATDDPDVSAQGWTYTVREAFTGVTGRPDYSIAVPLSALTTGLDLSTVAPTAPSGGTGVSYVLLSAHTELESRVATLEASTGSGGAGGVEHVQSTAAATWSIPHALARLPVVAVYLDGIQVETDVAATATDVVLTFPAPTTGTAVLT